MSITWTVIQSLVKANNMRISEHAYNELAEDGLFASEVIAGVDAGLVVEDYPTYAKGLCVLVLQKDSGGRPIHALWGVPLGKTEPAVLITVYRPDPMKWTPDNFRRRSWNQSDDKKS